MLNINWLTKSVDGWNPEPLDLVIFWLMIQILTHWVCESCKILNIKGHKIRETTQTSEMDRKVMSEAAYTQLYIWLDKNPTYAFHNCKYHTATQLIEILIYGCEKLEKMITIEKLKFGLNVTDCYQIWPNWTVRFLRWDKVIKASVGSTPYLHKCWI